MFIKYRVFITYFLQQPYLQHTEQNNILYQKMSAR
jgi:hypothetical protein